MKNQKRLLLVLSMTIGLLCPVVWAAPVYINNLAKMPDWNQPSDPGDANILGYLEWCAPTAVANAFGWWEDSSALGGNWTGLTDRLAYPITTAAPLGNPAGGQWMELLWQDGTIELGWHMNTDNWQNNNPQIPSPQGGGTMRFVIGPGGVLYAQAAWVDAPMTKVAFPNASVTTFVPGGATTATEIWNDYKNKIDNGLPVVVSWDRWLNSATEALYPGETDIYTYDWRDKVFSEGHTVTGIGYIDPAPARGDEWIIVHDNWSTTQKKVAVPLFTGYTDEDTYTTYWMQNDHFLIPEPATLALLFVGGLALLRRRR